ncbi:two-component regulator propeller domain-containing protein [uncultured Aquimarina sp.]|uniref:ligand-binding sensor domain-containing protein n=1 Tax=uncultured Aquimarina sp. TaxID=575652 RepID=UPI00261DCC24|nr:two-component regulator propeller domain-containing protein [uncultured Aquimarina sp.]
MIRHLLFIIGFVPFFVCSQVKFTHYTTDNGLPHDFTYQLFQDDDGYIWIGTDDGLAKFNGNRFKVLDGSKGFRSNYIIDIKKYATDTLAIATWKGGLHFIKNDSILIPEIENDNIQKINRVYRIGKDVLGANFGRYILYKREEGLKFIKKNLAIYIDRNGDAILDKFDLGNKEISNSWTAFVDDQVYFYRGVYSGTDKKLLKGIYRYKSEKEIELVFPFMKDKYIHDFGKYDATHYYATSHDDLYIFNINGVIRVDKHDFDDNLIHRFIKTSYCEVFVIKNSSSGEDKIYVRDFKNKTFQNITGKPDYQINVSDIYVDKDENIWITSKSDGLYQLSKEDRVLSEKVIDDNDIFDIATKDGKIFFLGLNRIYGYDKITKKLTSKELSSEAIGFRNEKVKNNKIHIQLIRSTSVDNSFDNHEMVNGEGHIKEEKGVAISNVSMLFSSSDKNQQRTRVSLENDNIIINDLAVINKEAWVATNLGIRVYDLVSHQHKRTITASLGEETLNIKKIRYTKEAGIWVATNAGLSRINWNGNIKYLDEKDGLDNTKINDIYIDHRGAVWIATQRGFSIYKDEMFYNFGKKEGLQSSYVSKIIEDDDHQIWIAGNKRAVRIDNTEAFKPITPPNLIVNKMDNEFIVDVIDYSGKQVTTAYRTNSTEDWRPFENKVLDINNYGVGDYNIQFRSRNPNSNWVYSNEYPFSIEQLWFKKLWFILLLSSLSTILISSIIFLQLRRVNNRNKLLQDTIAQSLRLEQELRTVRENVAQDFHDELGNKLAGITVMSELMMKDEELKQTKSIDMISQVRKDAKDLYFGIKDFVWSIDANSDDLKELMIYLTDFGEELFQNKGIIFKVEKHLSEENIKLPYYWSRQLLLLFKEAMTNSLKHAKATEVVLGFYVHNNILKISFSDNGVGFHSSELKRKNGLINMRKRAFKINGELVIHSENKTEILFRGKFR